MVKSAPAEEETRARARTRRAILEAAVEVLAESPSAPLSEVARTAGVARSTLQRYFAERADLVRALGEYAEELINEATKRARTTEGTGLEAFRRLIPEYFGLQRVVMLAFGGEETWEEDAEWGPADLALRSLVERGHADGSIDPEVTPGWARQILWAGLYAAWTYVNVEGTSAYEALNLCVRSLVKAVAAEGRGRA
ncbi:MULTISPECIES: TetR/AcrR family transcriptional regulator [unclassified Nocardiopsis]|uniref:TetR/AcrR family transcriptional regulator n=1 Tax=unclassified Nocardiopsis TaxID=2649073 RepID=UPI001357FF46|nr:MULTISPECIES: TetR/AcrR family transcriptional regulator [unclassified Nocardiopsis]